MALFQRKLGFIRNEEGMSTIEIVIGALIFIILFAFLFDLLVIMWKFSVVAHTNTEVARIAGLQGGALERAPDNYPGGDSNYTTIRDINNMVSNKFKSAWINDGDWEMTIGNGRVGRNGVVATRHDYMEEFTVKVEVDYNWGLMSSFLPGNLKQTISSERPAMGEWKYDYDEWIGE